jgi:hypothetical protein
MLGHCQFNWLWVLFTEWAFSSIQFTHESKYIHGYWYDLNGMEVTLDGSQCLDLMYDQTLGWSYVISPGMQRFDKQCWRKDLECRHVRERILIPCCICSWHTRDLQISSQIVLPRPESYDSFSQIKVYYSDRIWGWRRVQNHRRWEDQCWYNNHRIFLSYVTVEYVG